MRIRNTGESLSRPFPRLQRTRRCRGRTAHSDVKRRTSTCSPSPYRAASGLPALLPAATPVSNAPTCRRWSPYYIHRHRDTISTISTPSVAPSLHVTTTISVSLRRRLPSSSSAADCWPQAQSPRRLAPRPSPESGAAAQPVRTSAAWRAVTASASGLFHPTVSTLCSPAILAASRPPPSPSQPTPQ